MVIPGEVVMVRYSDTCTDRPDDSDDATTRWDRDGTATEPRLYAILRTLRTLRDFTRFRRDFRSAAIILVPCHPPRKSPLNVTQKSIFRVIFVKIRHNSIGVKARYLFFHGFSIWNKMKPGNDIRINSYTVKAALVTWRAFGCSDGQNPRRLG